jgi:hypothetical protein
MAASSTNSSKESDNLNSKSDQTLESFDESKKFYRYLQRWKKQ